jgi:hypothetical protein
MTAAEIQGYAEALANVAERFNQPVPEQPKASAFDLDREFPDGEYVDPGKVKNLFRQIINQPAPVDHTARNLAAQGLYGQVKAERADDFKRWGSEIDREIGKLDVSYWTYTNLIAIVKMVRGEHVDELVAEKAQRLANESHPTIRSGSGGLGSVSHTQQTTLESETIPAEWLTKARAAGITEDKVTEFCQTTGETREQFYANLAKYGRGAVISG